MGEKKRWIAMYTKHLTQKRKVYHDGFLDLHLSRKKVLLYDEAENLLESRMLKANEVVDSGQRLSFQAYLVDVCEPKPNKYAGTLPLGSANNGSNDHPLINSPRDGKSGADLSRRENDKYSKDVPPHKPLRDVNQILSILQRPNATATCSDTNTKTPMSSTKVPPESDTCKNIKVEPISPRAASRDSLPQQFMVRETSPAKTTARTMTHLNSSSPSFDLGI